MGISGLLPFLKEASTNVNIKQFEGSTVAVDTYCWIYRGAFSCAEQLALGQNADGHVKYVLRYVHKLLEWGIKPIMIFDGSCLPSKKGTELKRKESKEMNRKKAAQCLAEGRKNEAREFFQRCLECTPKMALDVIKALHNLGVDVIVAPYEADAQLAYLNKINVAQIIITEDSDLIPFGCDKVLYKMDINGFGQLIQKEKIISITQFDSADNFERFRWMCILSGCDYLENLPGIGLGKAKKLLKSINKSDIDYILKQMPKVLKMPNLIITNEYIESFKKADKTFKYQIVFDPLKRKLVSLHPYGPEIEANEDLTYAGFFYDQELSIQHSLGNIEVNTRERVYDFNPEKWNYKPPQKYSNNPSPHMRSVWAKNYMTFKSSNPFSSFTVKKDQPSLPNTTGLSKTLSIKSLKTSNESKRKFDCIEIEETSNKISVSNEESKESNESNESNKRSKLTNIKNDLDSLLNDYSTSRPKSLEIESSYESSGYFSSNSASISNSLGSPILNRSTQFASQDESTNSKTSPKKNFISILESLESDFKCDSHHKIEITDSPIVTEKPKTFDETPTSKRPFMKSETISSPVIAKKAVFNLMDKFSASTSQKFVYTHKKKEVEDEEQVNNGVEIEEEEEKEEEKENQEKTCEEIIEIETKETTNRQNQIAKTIMDDLETMCSFNGKSSYTPKASQTIKSKQKQDKNRKSNEVTTTKPISDYFKNFEFKKSSLKLNTK